MNDELLPGQMNFFDFLNEYNKPRQVKIKGLCDDPYCPNCHVDLPENPQMVACDKCGQMLLWDSWIKANKEWIK